MNKEKLYALLLLLFCYNNSEAQIDVKPNEIYLGQKQASNDIAAKSSLSPIALPDPKGMVAVNQSGDGVISLPFVTVKGRKLTLPINISYVTSGIKVDQSSSDVGLGWMINFGSITRDYGAYEPDYTYTGSEFNMYSGLGGTSWDGKLESVIHWASGPTISGGETYTSTPTGNEFIPINQNKILQYNNTTGKASDNYIVNVPGLPSNDFWNSDTYVPPAGSALNPPSFVFTEHQPWKISYKKSNIIVTQEASRVNEFNYTLNGSGQISIVGNIAAAIAMYPYVINESYANFNLPAPNGSIGLTNLMSQTYPPSSSSQLSPNMQVKYEDYSSFTITTDDGTQYVFGRPLRGQKYLFSEEPFWSSMSLSNFPPHGSGSTTNKVFDELWKTDYIAEWLLTEVHSADYVDANSNGIADDGDGGDWIRIDYGDPIQFENLGGIPTATPEPAHREFLNLTQTDRASSLWRERAYVNTITTPTEVITFDTSGRFDIDLDYFHSVFNRDNTGAYPYTGNYVADLGSIVTGDWTGMDPITSTVVSPTVTEKFIYVNYPAELKKYTGASVNENISGTNALVQNVTLDYAAQGSPQELAVSHYLMLKNDGTTFSTYDPSTLGEGLYASSFYYPDAGTTYNGRGKTTLLGIDYRGTSTTSADKISYSFNYGYNPSYDDIHKYQIWKNGAFPTMRECPYNQYVPRWTGVRTRIDPPGSASIYDIANSCLPYETYFIDPIGSFHTYQGENYNYPVYEDELGYKYESGSSSPLKGRDAWCLTGISMPYGGNIQMTYALDQTDIADDRKNWAGDGSSFGDYCIPTVGHYNNVADVRNLLQLEENSVGYNSGYDTLDMVKNYNEYFFLMNSNTGGLRISEVSIQDNFGSPAINKTYSYGTGHYTLPPIDFWSNYLSGFSAFVNNERLVQGTGVIFSPTQTEEYCDYNNTMSRLVSDTRVDNSIKSQATHYYEYIDEVNGDGSKTRHYYGKLYNNFTNPTPGVITDFKLRSAAIKTLGSTSGTNDMNVISAVLATDMKNDCKVGNYKTEYYDNYSRLVKSTKTNYNFAESNSNSITCAGIELPSDQYYAYVAESDPYGYGGLQEAWPSTEDDPPYSACCAENFFDRISSAGLSYMQYNNTGGTYSSQTPINITSEARLPFSKLAVNAGVYNASTVPSWYSPIVTGITAPFSSSPPDLSVVHSGISGLLNWCYDGGTGAPYGWFTDYNYYYNSLTYKSHQSYYLRPIQTTTVINFY